MEKLISIIGIILIIETKSINAIIYIILLIIMVGIYLISIKMNYISYTLIIIYLSAITILFIFVIMLINIKLPYDKKTISLKFFLFISSLILIWLINYDEFNYNFIHHDFISIDNIIFKIGKSLYENPIHIINLLIITLILFVALIGILYLFS